MAICLAEMNGSYLLVVILILVLGVMVAFSLYRHAIYFVFDEDGRRRMLEKWRGRRRGR